MTEQELKQIAEELKGKRIAQAHLCLSYVEIILEDGTGLFISIKRDDGREFLRIEPSRAQVAQD